MLHAYHMISGTAMERGQGGATLQATLAARFEAIRTEGILHPAPSLINAHPTVGEQVGNSFLLDHLAGDDHYIFLSLGRRYWQEPVTANYGFVFDTAQLLAQGAILRREDLLSDYEDLLDELVSAVAPARGPETWSAEETAALWAALADPDASDSTYQGPNDAYHNLTDAVLRGDDLPEVAAIRTAFRARATALQAAAQLTGEAALVAALAEGETGQYELLVPERLSLTHAAAHVIAGEEILL